MCSLSMLCTSSTECVCVYVGEILCACHFVQCVVSKESADLIPQIHSYFVESP